MSLPEKLAQFARLDLVGSVTPLEKLHRLSQHVGRDIYIKRDDLMPIGLGGNKLRKLEFLAAEALRQGADTLVTAGAIQSNHVRQTAAVAAKLGLHCVALLENPIATEAQNYLENGNRLLLGLFNTEVVLCDGLHNPPQQLQALAERIEAQGFRPYVIPIGGSNALGALGYVQCAIEIALQKPAEVNFAAVVVASGSAGTQAGLSVGLQQLLPETPLIGVTVSRTQEQQAPKVQQIQQELTALLGVEQPIPITLWDGYFAPGYGRPNSGGNDAIALLAQLEGILLDPVYSGKAMAGLLDGLSQELILGDGPVLFIHTGGSPALFAYYPDPLA